MGMAPSFQVHGHAHRLHERAMGGCNYGYWSYSSVPSNRRMAYAFTSVLMIKFSAALLYFSLISALPVC